MDKKNSIEKIKAYNLNLIIYFKFLHFIMKIKMKITMKKMIYNPHNNWILALIIIMKNSKFFIYI